MAEIAQALQGELPWWASAVAAVLLSVAAAVARRVARRSARPQGERLGELERRLDQERTRRLQVEDVLGDYGVELPWWPPDGPIPRRRPARVSGFPTTDEDELPDELPEDVTRERRIPVPPLPESERQRLARHAR